MGRCPNRKILLQVDQSARAELEQLDGCYVIKSDLRPEHISKQELHACYEDWARVEEAFSTCKTAELERGPVHVRCERSTRGPALAVMLAYRLIKELSRCWAELNVTVGEGQREVSTLCLKEVVSGEKVLCATAPQPRKQLAAMTAGSGFAIPRFIKPLRANLATKKKL